MQTFNVQLSQAVKLDGRDTKLSHEESKAKLLEDQFGWGSFSYIYCLISPWTTA